MVRPIHQTREHGYILISTLLIMLLVLALCSAMLIKSTSELRQSSNSVTLSASRELADAGQADARATLANTLSRNLQVIVGPYEISFAKSGMSAKTTPIISPTVYSTILSSLGQTYSQKSNSLGTGNYTYSYAFNNMRSDPTSFSLTSQAYYIDYTITATGTGKISGARTITSNGLIKVLLGKVPLNQFVFLADDGGSGSLSNGSLSGGFFGTGSEFDGPVHVNSNLALSGTPSFKQGLSVSQPYIYMEKCRSRWGGGGYVAIAGQQSTADGCTSPNTNGLGISYSTERQDLPKNATSQQRAALGLDSSNLNAPTNSEICQALGLASRCTVPSGVSIPSSNNVITGGIYVNGDSSIQLSVGSNGQQIYSITTGSTTTTVTVDYAANTTTVQTGTQRAVTYSNAIQQTQLYVAGDIVSLKGPNRTGSLPSTLPSNSTPSVIPPAIAAGTALNISASDSVTVSGDITYQQDPRTTDNATNVLGIMSGASNVSIGTDAPNDVYVHASILAGANGTGLAVTNYNRGSARGKIHLLGSLAEQTDQLRAVSNGKTTASGYDDDFKFDLRFNNGGLAPPNFPTGPFAVSSSLPILRNWTEN